MATTGAITFSRSVRQSVFLLTLIDNTFHFVSSLSFSASLIDALSLRAIGLQVPEYWHPLSAAKTGEPQRKRPRH